MWQAGSAPISCDIQKCVRKQKKAPKQVPFPSEKSSIRCAEATADVNPDFASLDLRLRAHYVKRNDRQRD